MAPSFTWLDYSGSWALSTTASDLWIGLDNASTAPSCPTTTITVSNNKIIDASGSTVAVIKDLEWNGYDLYDAPRRVRPKDVLEMPDGSVIEVDEHGNWVIRGDDATIRHRAHWNRDFNPFVNAGELVADFIDYVRVEVGLRPELISQLPLGPFVNWLIIEAAERDGDPIPDGVRPLPEDRRLVGEIHPRCRRPGCGRFVRQDWARNGYLYCDDGGQHAAEHGRLLRRAA